MTFSCASARLYLCTDARSGPEDLRSFVRACFAGGVDIVQVRDKTIEARDELAALAVVAEEARAAGRWVAANDRADVARLAGTDVLHVGQRDLRPEDAARVAPNAVIGMSTHTPEQMLAAANHPHVDYFCTGPIWATPTKPGRQAVGLDLVREAARLEADRATTGSPLKPWFAIGGVGEHTLDEVLEAGATRIVVVRALTQADNPKAAARRLRSRLEQAR